MPLIHLPTRPLTLHYALQGSGPTTVLLINGLADDLASWSLQLPALLAAGYRVLSFDNRGVGRSDHPPGPYTAELLADDAKALVEALGMGRVCLVGVSMGGMIAQAYALKYPADVQSLVLACTYASPGPFCSRMFALWADMARSTGLAFVRRDTNLWCFTQRFYREREAELLQMEEAAQGVEQGVEAYLAQLAVIQTFDSRERLVELGGEGKRVMVLVGEEDILIPVSLSRELWKGIPGAEWKAVKGGHAFAWEEAHAFNEAVIGFLKGGGDGVQQMPTTLHCGSIALLKMASFQHDRPFGLAFLRPEINSNLALRTPASDSPEYSELTGEAVSHVYCKSGFRVDGVADDSSKSSQEALPKSAHRFDGDPCIADSSSIDVDVEVKECYNVCKIQRRLLMTGWNRWEIENESQSSVRRARLSAHHFQSISLRQPFPKPLKQGLRRESALHVLCLMFEYSREAEYRNKHLASADLVVQILLPLHSLRRSICGSLLIFFQHKPRSQYSASHRPTIAVTRSQACSNSVIQIITTASMSADQTLHRKRRNSAGQEDAEGVIEVRSEGFTVLANPDAASLDVIFVHGLTGHPKRTWSWSEEQTVNHSLRSKFKRLHLSSTASVPTRKESRSVFWPQELLKHTLPNARILTYGYDSLIGHRLGQPVSTNTILDVGQNLLVSLAAQRRLQPSRPIIFVAHSLGGILVKEVLRRSESHREYQRDFYSVYNSTVALMFFGTPHRGADPQALVRSVTEKLLRAALFLPNDTLINGLLPNSERLKELREEFSKMLQTKRWKVYSFQEQYGIPILNGKKIVEDSSSNLDDPTVEITQHIAGNHMQICQFKGFEDSQYEIVAAAFGRLAPSEPVDIHSTTLLGSLAFERMGARLSNIRKAHHETCLWLFEQSEFEDWLNRTKPTEDHGFLWVKGKPGSGKSTIMKAALLETREKRPKTTIITYFFNARASDLLERSTLGMYRSLLHQLLVALPHLQQQFASQFTIKAINDNIVEWTVEEIQDFFLNTIEKLRKYPLIIFIDALDECEESEVRCMVEFLEELGQLSMRFEVSLNVCLSSRLYPHISIKKGASLVLEDQPGHDRDIVAYVNNKLIGDEGPQIEDLRSELYNKASGVFLWVVLVVPILNRLYDHGQVGAMRKRLSEIPKELDDLFTDILTRDANRKDEAILLLQWTLFAERPLSPVELYSAVQAGTTPSHEWNIEQPSKQTIDRYILSCSKGLTEFTKSKPSTVQFIHESVRAFLLHNNGLAKLQPELEVSIIGRSQDRLTKCCFQYFTEDKISKHDKKIVSSKFPFLKYATCNIFSHGDVAEREGVSQKNLLRLFYKNGHAILEQWIGFDNLFQRYKIRRYHPEDTLLYILSTRNLSNLVRALVNDSVNPNGPGRRYGNALQAACINGNETIARLLIDAKANVNAEGGEHHHALFAAIFSKNGAILELLQDSGASYPSDVNMLHRKLLSTIYRRYATGVAVLISAGANVYSANDKRDSQLILATQPEVIEIAELFLIRGNANAKQRGYSMALQTAWLGGHERIVRLLLDIGVGADINEQDAYHSTALYIASLNGHEAVVRLLLDGGANVNLLCKSQCGTALQAASSKGHEAVVRMLLKGGADVNAKDGNGGTVLQAASSKGHDAIVQLLKERGAT
ncbi:hypothetical protein MMC11_008238 [Xylographa trunciseda]|nr:hypothetical protein [Xylographa trunciseda]